MTFNKKKLLDNTAALGFIILLFSILIYLPSLSVPFVNDEISFIQRNEISSIKEFPTLLEKKDYDGYYYRPVGNLISGVFTLCAGYNSAYYRMFNSLTHSLAALLVFIFVLTLFQNHDRKKELAFFSALIFSSFPLHDYAVIWHTDLFDRVMLIFYLAGLISFAKKFRITFLSIQFFLLALLSKEMAFSFPLTIFIVNIFFSNDKEKILESLKKTAPYFLALILILLFRAIILDNNLLTAQDAHSYSNLIDMIRNYIFFAGLLVFPLYVRDIQNYFLANPFEAIVIVTAAAVPLLLLFYKILKKDKAILFFILFIIISLAPASRLLMRWYLYLPSIGLAMGLPYLILSIRFKKRIYAHAILLLILLLYSFALIQKEILWVQVSKKADRIMHALVNDYGVELHKTDKVEFFTLPAKVADIPVFQLGFQQHLNFYLKKECEVTTLSKSSLESFSDTINYTETDGEYLLTQSGGNYFILSDISKNVKLNRQNFKDGKLKQISITPTEEPNKIFFTFSNSYFKKIGGE